MGAQLPFSATAATIQEHFENEGVTGITGVKLISEKGTNKRGMAFVQFSSDAGVQAALELNESQFGGRRIVVERSSKSETKNDSKNDKKNEAKTVAKKVIFDD